MSKAGRRSAARLAAAQALYQMEVADKGLADILAELLAFALRYSGRKQVRDSGALFFSLLPGNSATQSKRRNLDVGLKHVFRAVA